MAKMKFGPWLNPDSINLKPHQFYDVVFQEINRAWIKPDMIRTARRENDGWRQPDGVRLGGQVRWIRERSWCEPEDLTIDATVPREGLELSHNQDGSGRVVMYDAGQVLGEITIPANQFETIAAWFAQAHRSNQL